MHTTREHDLLDQRLGEAMPELRPPAVLLKRLAEVVGDEQVLLVAGDLHPLGFGAYGGQLCLVTPTLVVLATGTHAPGPEGAFGVEHWSREIGAVPRSLPRLPARPAPPEL